MSANSNTEAAVRVQPENAGPDAISPKNWRRSKLVALVEFVLIGLIFYADHRKWIPFSKTPELLLLGWVSLRLRGLRWCDVGLVHYRSWARTRTLALGLGLGVLIETFQLTVTQPILSRLLGSQPDLELFQILTGNWKMTALFIALSWTLAAFGEEMFWRGYLLNRIADVVGQTRAGWVVSLVIVSVVFGFAHEYQGLTGLIEESLAGLYLGVMYLATRRNLSVPILAHGVSNTIDMVLIYLGKMPGV